MLGTLKRFAKSVLIAYVGYHLSDDYLDQQQIEGSYPADGKTVVDGPPVIAPGEAEAGTDC